MPSGVGLQYISVLALVCTGSSETSEKVIQLPRNVTKYTGANVSFHCSLPLFQGDSAVSLLWWKEGDVQYQSTEQDDRKVRGSKNKISGFLQIINVTAQDAGVYYCTVTHRGKFVGNGTGSKLLVWVPPTPLKITSEEPGRYSSASVAVRCSTSPFFPENISFIWYKDGNEITTGINAAIKPTAYGLYEASSWLQGTEAIRSGAVYTCLVKHSALQVSASVSHIAISLSTGGAITQYLLIATAAGGGLALLVLALIIVRRCISKHRKAGAQVKDGRCKYPEQEKTTNVMSPYAALDMKKLPKAPRTKHEESTVYTQTKKRPLNSKVTYVALEIAGSKNTETAHYKDKNTEYAQIRMEKQRTNVLKMQQQEK